MSDLRRCLLVGMVWSKSSLQQLPLLAVSGLSFCWVLDELNVPIGVRCPGGRCWDQLDRYSARRNIVLQVGSKIPNGSTPNLNDVAVFSEELQRIHNCIFQRNYDRSSSIATAVAPAPHMLTRPNRVSSRFISFAIVVTIRAPVVLAGIGDAVLNI